MVGGDYAEGGVHAVVAGAAELGAEDGVGSGGGGGEVEMNGLAGDGVLLETHLGDGEAVDDVLSVEAEIDLAVGGEDKLGGDLVVGGVGVGGVKTQGIAFAGGYKLGLSGAEGGIGAGVAEVPDELGAGDLDLEGGEAGPGVAGVCPEALGFDGQGGEEEGESDEGDVFDAPEAGRLGAAAGVQADEEDEMGED